MSTKCGNSKTLEFIYSKALLLPHFVDFYTYQKDLCRMKIFQGQEISVLLVSNYNVYKKLQKTLIFRGFNHNEVKSKIGK